MIEDQVNALKNMNLVELKQLWLDYFKEPAPAFNAIKYYVPRLAYRMQELEYGGVPASLKAKELGFSIPGTSIVRIYHKQEYVVFMRNDGFEYNGKSYKTLSTIAREITGRRVSGRYFFGIKGNKK